MNGRTYIVATIRQWNIHAFNKVILKYPGEWHLITQAADLSRELVQRLKPRYIFFPHWNHIVPREVLEQTECVCFHETDLPYGLGGSPIQNLIAKGHKETKISAIKMIEKLDAGPIYLKRPLVLEGLAEEIFIRASMVVAEMILEIVTNEPEPKEQEGVPVIFNRRTSDQSEIPIGVETLQQLFDHIRMLDASGYPCAFLRYGNFRIEITRPALRTHAIEADISIALDVKGNY